MLGQTLRNVLLVAIPGLLVALFLGEWLDRGGGGPPADRTPAPAEETVATARPAPPDSFRELAVRAARNGHFIVEATVNGHEIRFLVDTGATDVALRREDARRLGFDPDLLRYDREYRTANGVTRAASVTLREVGIGQISMRDVAASVSEGELQISLLGMSFLSRLEGYEVRGDRLILRW